MNSDENLGPVRPFGFRAPRVSTSFSLSVEVIATGERYQAVCTDISEEGLAVDLREPLGVQTEIVVRMLLPGGVAPLQVQCKVEYCQERRCGMNFVDLSPEDQKQIRIFLRSVS